MRMSLWPISIAMFSSAPWMTAPVIGVEAGVEMGWQGYADGFVGMKRFGASAPGEVVMDKFCFTAEHVAERSMELLAEIVSFREVVQNRLETEMSDDEGE